MAHSVTRQASNIILTPQTHKRTLIWLHGLGDSAQGFLPVFQQYSNLLQDCKYVLLTAPERRVTLNMGMMMTSWYDITSLGKREINDELLESTEIVKQALDEERKHTENLYLGGFSQGGALSLFTGLQYEHQLKGIVALSCYTFEVNNGEYCGKVFRISDANRNTPIFIYHGLDDQVIPERLARLSYEEQLGGLNYTYQSEEGLGHSLSVREITALQQWFGSIPENQQLEVNKQMENTGLACIQRCEDCTYYTDHQQSMQEELHLHLVPSPGMDQTQIEAEQIVTAKCNLGPSLHRQTSGKGGVIQENRLEIGSESYRRPQYMIRNQIQNLNQLNACGKTRIYEACYKGNFRIINMLLKQGANPKIQCLNERMEKENCLDLAVRSKQKPIVNVLLKKFPWSRKEISNVKKFNKDEDIKLLLDEYSAKNFTWFRCFWQNQVRQKNKLQHIFKN